MMKPRMHRPFSPLPQRQRGAVIVLIVVALAAILLMGALALDGGHMLLNKTRLQNAVDAAALSGAKTLSQVLGTPESNELAREAALATLMLNANASGNKELATAIAAAGGVERFAKVMFSIKVDGDFEDEELAARFVRVQVSNYPLAGFFWSFAQSPLGNPDLGDKVVAAIATAGLVDSSPCNLAPLMVCGDPTKPDDNWGFIPRQLKVLKTAKNNTSNIGPGNFQLLDFGAGGKTVRELLAGGGTLCPEVGENVATKPGNTVGPSVQGFNTRFGEYLGPMGGTEAIYPQDLVTTYSQLNNGQGAMAPNLTDGTVSYLGTGGGLVSSSPRTDTDPGGHLTAGAVDLYDINNWQDDSATCLANSSCNSAAAYGRRMLTIVIGQCPVGGTDGGTASVPVLGFGCFFTLQPMDQSGGQAWLLGQFDTLCDGGGTPVSQNSAGPKIIQLYKSYADDGPSPDS